MSQIQTKTSALRLRETVFLRAVLTAALLLAAMISVQPALARGAPDSFADLAERLSPSVVNISTVQAVRNDRSSVMPNVPPGSPLEEFFEEFFNGPRGNQDENAPPRRTRSLGSGFIIDEEGYIVTNNHVILDAFEVSVRLNDGTEIEAEIVGRDPEADLALLKIETDKELKAVSFGDSDVARVGDWVLTIGNPFGLGGSVTAGIISARNRDLNAGNYDEYLQTDAPINRGNSGGPMFNMDGEVVGVNTAIFSPTGGNIGIGFAVPSNVASRVVAQLREYGYARRGFLGVTIQAVTDEMAEALGLSEATGAIVSSVNEDGPADQAGIEPGDVILEFDGKPISDGRELARVVSATEIGKAVKMKIIRDGDRKTIAVKTGELPRNTDQVTVEAQAEQAEPERSRILGMELSGLNATYREQFGLQQDVKGLVVTDLDRRSEAARRGLVPGDVIVQVNREQVTDPDQLRTLLTDARDAGREHVLVRVYRQNSGGYGHLTLPTEEESGR